MAAPQETQREVEITERELPLHCPTPRSPVWSMHPRVFLDVARTGKVLCPYCGTTYLYKGAPQSGH